MPTTFEENRSFVVTAGAIAAVAFASMVLVKSLLFVHMVVAVELSRLDDIVPTRHAGIHLYLVIYTWNLN